MPPEQLRSSKSVDPRSDVWSLGVLLHELIVGEPPFIADTLPGLLAKIIADPPTPLCSGRPDAPAALEAVVARCLAKDPANRYQSVSEFALALQPFAPDLAPNRFSRTLFGVHDSRPEGSSPVNTPRVVHGMTSQGGGPVDTAGGRAAWAAGLGPLSTRSFRGVLGVAGIVALIGATLWLARPRERTLVNAPVVPKAPATGLHAGGAGGPSSAVERVKPIVTPLNRARWAALEQATLTNHARLVAPVTSPQADALFDDRK
jgi:serine/threonine-protein kinase